MTTLRKLRRQMDIISAEVSLIRDIRDREIKILTDNFQWQVRTIKRTLLIMIKRTSLKFYDKTFQVS